MKRWLVGATGLVLAQVWACSPVNFSDPGTDEEDAAVTEGATSRSDAQTSQDTSEGPVAPPVTPPPVTPPPVTPPPVTPTALQPTSSSDSEAADASSPDDETSPPTGPATSTSSELAASTSEADETSVVVDPPVDPECLTTPVEAIPAGLAGFAQVAGYDLSQTSGGSGGEVVYVGSEQALRRHLTSSEPRVVVVCGEIVLNERLRITSNKTLLGLGPSSVLRGGIDIHGTADSYVGNVIIANLVLDPSMVLYAERIESLVGLRVEFAHHVWLDHLEVYNAPQGLIDVVWGSDLVTLSWNKFYFTQETPDLERRFGVRVGDVNDASVLARDGGKLRVTLHHNWFGDFIRQRMPRVAYGQAHIFNNYYSTTDNDTTIWGLSEYAEVLVEANYFQRTHRPHDIPLTSEVTNDELARMVAFDNVYYGTTGARKTQGSVFAPPYTIERDSVVWLPSLIPWGAGPHATFDPKPAWSDAGIYAPDGGVDAGQTSSATSDESSSNELDASVSDSIPSDASLGGGATSGG